MSENFIEYAMDTRHFDEENRIPLCVLKRMKQRLEEDFAERARAVKNELAKQEIETFREKVARLNAEIQAGILRARLQETIRLKTLAQKNER